MIAIGVVLEMFLRLEALVDVEINLTWLEISDSSVGSLKHLIKNIKSCS